MYIQWCVRFRARYQQCPGDKSQAWMSVRWKPCCFAHWQMTSMQAPGIFYKAPSSSSSLSLEEGNQLHLNILTFTLSSVQSLSHVWLFATPWTAASQASLSITSSQSLFKFMSIESVKPSNHFILCRPLLLLLLDPLHPQGQKLAKMAPPYESMLFRLELGRKGRGFCEYRRRRLWKLIYYVPQVKATLPEFCWYP